MNQDQKISIFKTWEFWFMMLAFVLWAFMFRPYLSGKAILDSDAVSYYDHIKFFIDNLSKGVFPLWDPFWYCGASNTFFLQRMGCFNPFLFLILIFKAVGFSHTNAYLIYLMVYYFIGCIGFYLLARCVIKNSVCAFVAFSLLLFSALGTRIFDSFMILMFTPMAWFFYFWVSFSLKPSRHAFVGIFFTLMLVATTYIPFYFLMSVGSFVICHAVVYAHSWKGMLINYFRFVSRNKILTILCTALLISALVPGYLFFKSGGKNDYVMPKRNTSQGVESVLGVQSQSSSNSWALLEEFFFAYHYYTDITQIPFAVIYVPLFAVIIFLLGFFTKINKKILLLFLWIAGLFLICVPMASPIYSFLYEHIKFFKYFRNLHFFLWVTILPAVCLLLGEQLKCFLAWSPSGMREKGAYIFYVVLVHGILGWFLWHNHYPVGASYCVVLLSCIFFLVRLSGSFLKKDVWISAMLLFVIAIEPWQMYGYLSQNTLQYQPYVYAYDWTSGDFRYLRNASSIETVVDNALIEDKEADPGGGRVITPAASFYYASKWFVELYANLDTYIIRKYRTHKFVIYDEVQKFDDNNPDMMVLETALAENRNVAFVSSDDPSILNVKPSGQVSYYARTVSGPTDDFRVDSFTANSIRIKTNFSRPQFLVYNDNDHKEWRLFVNGKNQPIIRTNLAFKGLWVPAGEQTIEFKYGLPQTWFVYMSVFFGINGIFILLVVFAWRELRRPEISQHNQDAAVEA